MTKYVFLALVFFLVALSAKGQSYDRFTFVDAAFFDSDFGTGLEVDGAFALSQVEGLSLIGSFAFGSEGNVDINWFTLGAGWSVPIDNDNEILKRSSLFVHGEIERLETTIELAGMDYESSDTGFLVGAELRIQAIEELEAFGDLSLRTTGSTDFLFTAGARYSINEKWLAFASFEFSDLDVLQIGARYQF